MLTLNYQINSALSFSETITIVYDEPTLNTDLTPITNMTHVSIDLWLVTKDGTEIEQSPILIPASRPGGGGSIEHQTTINGIDAYEFIKIRAITINEDNLKTNSMPTSSVLKRIDRTLPAPPK